jgi:hypothetical protein
MMRSTRNGALSLVLATALGGAAHTALADACVDFKWDVSRERALFATAPVPLTAGHDSLSAPDIVPNRLYRLRLLAHDQVAFSVPPGRKTAAAPTPTYAGLAALKIETPGNYRVAVEIPLWVDVVSYGALLPPTDFQGQRDCNAPHKIVEFDLAGVHPFILQLSNAANEDVLLTVTPTPPRKL